MPATKEDRSECAKLIREKALSLGFTKCGIICTDAVAGYKKMIEKRAQRFPMSAMMYSRFKHFSDVRKQFPWARSVVVVVEEYRRYKAPEGLRGRIGLAYQFDSRADQDSEGFRKREELKGFIEKMGFRVGCESKYGITAERYAAVMAGLGVMRNNNFFYTENGSWNAVFSFAIDGEMELIGTHDIKECPVGCNRCIKACPTGALCEPFTMNPFNCVSFITSRSESEGLVSIIGNPIGKSVGSWIFGCDACQDACPMNRDRLTDEIDFPGLSGIAANLSPEQIVSMDPEYYRNVISRKFFYLDENRLWRWKVNALNAMVNAYEPRYEQSIKKCLKDPDRRVREMASLVCRTLGIVER